MSIENVSEYVTLVSNDGYEFKLLRSAACIAGTIKRALNPECEWPFLCYQLDTDDAASRLSGDDTEPHGLPYNQVCHLVPARADSRSRSCFRTVVADTGKWCCSRESLRISILQPEACGKQRRLRHGHPPRAVLGTTDCCRLLGWYATLVFQDPALCLRPGSLKNQESRIPQRNCISQDLRAKTSTMLASPVACKPGRQEEHGWAGVWDKSCYR
jgi:hypothetical protein